MESLISIIIPIYNAETYLTNCIKSVINQSFKNWELLLINDGSTDSSSTICHFFSRSDARIRVFDIKNDGVSNARNLGLNEAKGEYIKFIDADDWIDPETCLESLECIKKSGADVVLYSYFKVTDQNVITKDTYLEKNSEIVKDTEMFKYRVIGLNHDELNHPTKTDAYNTPWAKLYRRSLIEDNKIRYIRRSEVGMEDVLFNIMVIQKASSFTYLKKYFYYYRLDNPNSLTKVDTKLLLNKFENLFRAISSNVILDKSGEQRLNNRVAFSAINITLSMTNKNNRTGLNDELNYLRSMLYNSTFIKAFKSLNLNKLPLHWQFYYYLCRNKMVIPLYTLSYIIRFIK